MAISFGQQVAFFPATNGAGGGWVAIGSGITCNPSTNQVIGGTFSRLEYYTKLTPLSYYDDIKKRTVLSDFDYKSQDYCLGIQLADPATPFSTLRTKLPGGLQNLLLGNDMIGGDGPIKSADFGIFGYAGDDTISPYTAKLASGGDGNDFFDSIPKQRAVLFGGNGNDRFDGSSGTDPGDAYYWIGGSGANRYEMPSKNTVIIVDRKLSAGQADVVLYGSALLSETTNTKIIINAGSVDPTKLVMRWVNADLNELKAVGNSLKLNRLAFGGYVSITLDGIEQVKISLVEGMDESEYEKKYRAIIAKKIGIGDLSTLVNTQGFGDTVLSQVKSELGLTALNYAGPDLTKTIASHGSFVSSTFALKSIAQENGVLTFKFNQAVGNAGNVYILESKSDGSISGTSSLSISDIKVSGDTVTARLNTSASGNEKLNYLLWFVSGWTSSKGEALIGQGSPMAGVSSDAYGFSYQKDTVAPVLQSSEVIDGKIIRLQFSEPITKDNIPAYVLKVPNPTSINDALTNTSDFKISGNSIDVILSAPVDGTYYFAIPGVRDLAGNSYVNNRPIKLSFIDPLISANRIILDRSDPSKSSFLLPVKLANVWSGNSVDYVSFNWKADDNVIGSDTFGQTFQRFDLARNTSLTAAINCNAFAGEGIHRLNQVNISFKNGGSIAYASPAEINDFLSKCGLKQGSLDVVVKGKAETASLALNSVLANSSEWDPNDANKAVYVDIAYTYSSSLSALNASGRLDSLSLKYKRLGSGDILYLRSDSMVVHPSQASFLLKPGDDVSIQAGDYELEEVLAYGSPHLNDNITITKGSDDYAKLNLPKNLKILKDWKPAQLQRQLVSLELTPNTFDLTQKLGQDWGGCGSIIKAGEIIQIPAQGIDSLISESITLGFESQEYNVYRASLPSTSQDRIYRQPTATLKVKSVKKLTDTSAAVELAGYLNVPANCYGGTWKYSSVYLQNTLYPSGNSFTRDQNGLFSGAELASGLLPILNNTAFSVQGGNPGINWNAVTLEAPITQPAAFSSQLTVDAQANDRKVVLDIIIQDPTLNPKQSDPTYLDTYLGAYLGANGITSGRPRGVVTLVSPSGRQHKVVLLDDSSLFSYGRPIGGLNAPDSELVRFSPTITFSPNDESGVWRIGRVITWTGSADPHYLISAGTSIQNDSKLNDVHTLALAKQLALEPGSLEINLQSNGKVVPTSNPSRVQEFKSMSMGFSRNTVELAKGAVASIDFVMSFASNCPVTNLFSVITGNTFSAPVGYLDIYNTAAGIVGRSNTIHVVLRKDDLIESVSIGAAGETVYNYKINKTISLDSSLQAGQYAIGRFLLAQGSEEFLLSDNGASDQFSPIIDIGQSLTGSKDSNGRSYRTKITDAALDFAAHQLTMLGAGAIGKEKLSFTVANSSPEIVSAGPLTPDSFKFLSPAVLSDGQGQYIDLQISQATWQNSSLGDGIFGACDPLLLLVNSHGNYKAIALGKGTATQDGASLQFRVRLDSSFSPDTWFAVGLSNLGNSLLASLDGIAIEDGISDPEAGTLRSWFGSGSSFQLASNSSYHAPSINRSSILRFQWSNAADFLTTNAPQLQSILVSSDGTKLQLNYNSSLASVLPALNCFQVKVDNVICPVRTVAIADSTVSLALATPIYRGQAVTLTYGPPANDPGRTNPAIQDLLGNDAAAFNSIQVTNGSVIVLPVVLPKIALTLAPASVAEDGSTNLMYTFSRTGSTSSSLSVNYTVSGSAALGTDYTGIAAEGSTKTVTFAAGASTAIVTVDPTADSAIEADETVVLTLAASSAYTIGTTAPVVGTIKNDDTLPIITLEVSPASVFEDGAPNLIYTFKRTGSTASSLSVNYTVSGSATLGTDYTGISTSADSKTLTFAVGSSTALVTVDPTADRDVESDETVVLTLAASSAYTIGTSTAVVGTIKNDDTLPIITLEVSPASVLEDGAANLIYVFKRTGSTTSSLSVNYMVGGSATLGTDYTGIAAERTTKSVTFAANAATAVVTVDPTADGTVEGDETVVLSLAAGTGYTLGTTAAVVGTIKNDDVSSAVTTTLTSGQSTLVLTGTANINGTGNELNNAMTGNLGNNSLNGGFGNDTLIGGAGIDVLIGGDGVDTFLYPSLNDILIGGTSNARIVEKISDFQIGTDVLDAPGGARTKKNLAAVTALTDGAIASVLTSADFGSGALATFTYGTGSSVRTFVALNDSTAGFDATKDGIIEITGYSGTLTQLNAV